MIYQVLSAMRVTTLNGEIEIEPGQIISISPEKAIPFIKQGRVIPLSSKDPYACLKEMLDRIDRIYRNGDLMRLKRNSAFWKGLVEKEDNMAKAIIDKNSFEEAIREYEIYLKQGVRELRRFEINQSSQQPEKSAGEQAGND